MHIKLPIENPSRRSQHSVTLVLHAVLLRRVLLTSVMSSELLQPFVTLVHELSHNAAVEVEGIGESEG